MGQPSLELRSFAEHLQQYAIGLDRAALPSGPAEYSDEVRQMG